LAVTCTGGSVLADSVAAALRMTTALPSREAESLLPASSLSSACCSVRRPETAGAPMRATVSPDARIWVPVCRDSSFSAAASGCAGKLMSKLCAAAGAVAWAEARLLQPTKVVPNAAASAALRRRWRGEECMSQGSKSG
jgi:hypothetical protein